MLTIGPTSTGSTAAALTVRAVSANTTAAAEELLEVDASGGARTVAPPASPTTGMRVTVVKTDSSANAVTWSGTTNGDPNATIVTQWAGATFAWDGAKWLVYSVNVAASASSGGGASSGSPLLMSRTVAGSTTAAVGELILANASAGDVTVTLPKAAAGVLVEVKKTDASTNRVIVVAQSGDTIGITGAAAVGFPLPDLAVVFQANGTNWVLTGGYVSVSQLDTRYSPQGPWDRADLGLLAWTVNPLYIGGGGIPTSGSIRMSRIKLPTAATVTNVVNVINTGGTGLTSGQCFAGIYSTSFALLAATGDQSTAWTTAGVKTMTLTAPLSLLAGEYYVALLANGTTPPNFLIPPNALALHLLNRPATSALAMNGDSSVTTLPATVAPGAANSFYWFGLS